MSESLLLKIELSFWTIVGAVMCFYGYRAFRLVLAFLGVLLGGGAAAAAGYQLSEGNYAVAVFCGLIGALLGGVLLIALYLTGVFVYGALAGGALAYMFLQHAAPAGRTAAVAVVAAIGGIVALCLQRVIITAITAFNGACLMVGGVWLIYTGRTIEEAVGAYFRLGPDGGPKQPPPEHLFLFLGASVALACLGAWAQFSTPPPTPTAPAIEPLEPREKRWSRRSERKHPG